MQWGEHHDAGIAPLVNDNTLKTLKLFYSNPLNLLKFFFLSLCRPFSLPLS